MSKANSGTSKGSSQGETHTNLAIRQVAVAGAAAGTTIVPAGWVKGSALKSVLRTDTWADLTANFTEQEAVGATAGIKSAATNTAGLTLLCLFIVPGLGLSLTRGS